MNDSVYFVGLGIVVYLVARLGVGENDPAYFGSWRRPPRWARAVFGSNAGSISPYKYSTAVTGITWAVCSLSIAATGNPPGPPLRLLLLAPILVTFGVPVFWAIIWIGRERQLSSRSRRK